MEIFHKGGGVLSFFSIFFTKHHSDHILTARTRFGHSLSFILVVEVTLNRAEYGSQRLDQPENVNF